MIKKNERDRCVANFVLLPVENYAATLVRFQDNKIMCIIDYVTWWCINRKSTRYINPKILPTAINAPFYALLPERY